MNVKEFKKEFFKIAKLNGFIKSNGGWFKNSNECIIILDLQKSNFGNYYDLNIKIFIQGLYDKSYVMDKNLIKNEIGHIFLRQPKDFNHYLNLQTNLDFENVTNGLEELFKSFINPVTHSALTRFGIKDLSDRGIIYLLPAVKEQLLEII